jgi:hypothetical protein
MLFQIWDLKFEIFLNVIPLDYPLCRKPLWIFRLERAAENQG